MPRIMVIAAEASADAHAAAVIGAVKKEAPRVEVFGMAGPQLRAVGVEAVARAEDVSVMGLTEVMPAIPRILRMMRRLENAAATRMPDLAILVDSPDLNLRMAARLRRLGIPILYYIAPMVWAWRRGRVRQVKRLVDRLCVILPFEETVWKEAGVDAVYVGNPLADDALSAKPPVEAAGESAAGMGGAGRAPLGPASRESPRPAEEEILLALLPGSRRMEIRRCLPPMLESLRLMAKRTGRPLRAVIPVAPTIDPDFILDLGEGRSGGVSLELSSMKAIQVLRDADVALIASGTAALEAALAKTPMVVVYKVTWTTWLVGRVMVRTPFVSLPNLLAGRAVVPELLQSEMRPERVAAELERILPGSKARDEMLAALESVAGEIGAPGVAEAVAAEALAVIWKRKGERTNE